MPEADANAVTAKLVAAGDAIVPGEPLLVGVHVEMKPGWHTYWKNGGDAGLPTEIAWRLPAGFVAGEIQWPTPHRYVEGGDLVTYGYADDVLLMVEIQTPADLRVGSSVSLEADVSWLMCKELCIPGDAKVALSLPVAETADASAQAAYFVQTQAQLPIPADEIDGLDLDTYLSLNAVPPGQSAVAAIVLRGAAESFAAAPTWFPETNEGLWLEDVRWTLDPANGRATLLLPFEVDAAAAPGETIFLRGVAELAANPGSATDEHIAIQVALAVPVATPGQALSSPARGRVRSGCRPHRGPVAPRIHLALPAAGAGRWRHPQRHALRAAGALAQGDELRQPRRRGPRRAVPARASSSPRACSRRFLALALVVIGLQSAGELLGWGFQFQNPAFVVVMAAIVFAFGLSLFGVYEIILPVQIGWRRSHGRYAESFLNGILATALATPCTAPFSAPRWASRSPSPRWRSWPSSSPSASACRCPTCCCRSIRAGCASCPSPARGWSASSSSWASCSWPPRSGCCGCWASSWAATA